jgi:hypothetical protein
VTAAVSEVMSLLHQHMCPCLLPVPSRLRCDTTSIVCIYHCADVRMYSNIAVNIFTRPMTVDDIFKLYLTFKLTNIYRLQSQGRRRVI